MPQVAIHLLRHSAGTCRKRRPDGSTPADARERAVPPGAVPAALRPRAAAHRSAPIGGLLSTSVAGPPPGRPRAPPVSRWRYARPSSLEGRDAAVRPAGSEPSPP